MPKNAPQSGTEGTAPPHTAAEALHLLATWTDLKEDRRRDLAHGLNTMVSIAGLPAEAVVLDADERFADLDRASPNALGIAASTFANRCACIRYVFRRLGLLAPRRVRTPALPDPAWAPLLERLPPGPRFGRLKALIAYSITEGIPPEAVGPATLDGYAEVSPGRARRRQGTRPCPARRGPVEPRRQGDRGVAAREARPAVKVERDLPALHCLPRDAAARDRGLSDGHRSPPGRRPVPGGRPDVPKARVRLDGDGTEVLHAPASLGRRAVRNFDRAADEPPPGDRARLHQGVAQLAPQARGRDQR